MQDLPLQEQIQSQRQQPGILTILTVSRHQKKQYDDQKVPGVQILRKKLTEKGSGTVGMSIGRCRLFA